MTTTPELVTLMTTTPELVALVQREREHRLENDRLARIATCAWACCNPTLGDRLARVLRVAPPTC